MTWQRSATEVRSRIILRSPRAPGGRASTGVTSSLTGTAAVDNLRVYLSDQNGNISNLVAFSNLNKGTLGVYAQQGPYDLSAFAGQSVTLFFRATTTNSFGIGSSIFRIDDVAVTP
jgi:hypothetical protein